MKLSSARRSFAKMAKGKASRKIMNKYAGAAKSGVVKRSIVKLKKGGKKTAERTGRVQVCERNGMAGKSAWANRRG